MQNVSALGISGYLTASRTFPTGFLITTFETDADPFDISEITIAEADINVNGELIQKSSPEPLVATINVIPGSFDDMNLMVLLNANRAGYGKFPANDIITLTLSYPSGDRITYTNGIITGGNLAHGVSSDGRLQAKAFSFAFENVSLARGLFRALA